MLLARSFSFTLAHKLLPFAGRTGRAGKQGTAITFLMNDDDEVMYAYFTFCKSVWLRMLTYSPLRLTGLGMTSNKVRKLSFRHQYHSTDSASNIFTPNLTEISKSPVSKVPPELARHEAAQARVTREMKRKRDAEDQG